MPDYSILSETKLTLLLENALLEYWNEQYDIAYLSSLKMHKIMFSVAERENLPITRSWYILGSNIHDRELVRKEFGWNVVFNPQNINLQDGSILNIDELKQEYSEIYQVLKNSVISFIESSRIIFTPRDEYLFNIYDKEAPKKFAGCYRASLDYRIFLTRLPKLIQVYNSEKLKMSCMNKTTMLHQSICQINEFHGLFELLYEYTDTIEEAILKNAASGEKGGLNTSQYDFFNGQDQIYLDYVWKPFAKIISIETVTGPRKEQIISEYKTNLRDLSEYAVNIQSNSKRAKELNLFLTKKEFNSVFIDKKQQLEKIIEAGDLLQRG